MSYPVLNQMHIKKDLGLDQAKALFKNSVRFIEIETFSYCNRRCWYCPNSIINRFDDNTFLDEKIYRQILTDLSSIEYDGEISFSRYNEPLSDRRILDHLRLAKTMTNAKLRMHTNGDYLTPLYLQDLYDAGLRAIYVQVYLNGPSKTVAWKESQAKKQIALTMGRIGVECKYDWGKPNVIHTYRGSFNDMDVIIECKNFSMMGVDRGGLMPIRNVRPRSAPCFFPVHSLYVDYNGAMVPCCNIRSDATEHEGCVLYELTGETDELFRAYVSDKFAEWRSRLLNFNPKEGVCRTCRTLEHQRTPALEIALQSLTATYE
jgi:hypothetical protein